MGREQFYMESKDSRLKEIVFIRVDQELNTQLKTKAIANGTTVSSLAREILTEGLTQ